MSLLEPVSVDVCVATRGRPAQLADLLDSLERVRVPDGVELAVVVVDDDPAGSASDVLAARRAPLDLTTTTSGGRGIAAARNAALRASTSDWVAFVDDDERLHPDWLEALWRTAREHDADVVAGPVLPLLPEGAPDWVRDGGWFERKRHPTGTRLTWAATNNVLVRRAAIDRLSSPWFDTTFGLTGGSDLELFTRLHHHGCVLVWCDEAVVEEDVPLSRAERGWLLRRALRLGNGTGRLMLRRRARLLVLGYGGVQVLRGLVATTGALLRLQRPGRPELWPFLTGLGVLIAVAGLTVSEYGGRFLSRSRQPGGEGHELAGP